MPNILEKMLIRLTDNYSKDSGSKIGRLLNIVATELEEIKDALETTEKYRDIDQAIGVTLDREGQNVQQFRGVANDEIYRILIKSKIASNLSTGDIDTIIRVLAITLNTVESDIKVEELYNASSDPEPAAVFISVPTVLLNQVGFSINQFGRLVNKIVAGGVRAKVFFQGTFSFSSQLGVIETNTNAGFADIDKTTGGFFGAVYDPGDDQDLPL